MYGATHVIVQRMVTAPGTHLLLEESRATCARATLLRRKSRRHHARADTRRRGTSVAIASEPNCKGSRRRQTHHGLVCWRRIRVLQGLHFCYAPGMPLSMSVPPFIPMLTDAAIAHVSAESLQPRVLNGCVLAACGGPKVSINQYSSPGCNHFAFPSAYFRTSMRFFPASMSCENGHWMFKPRRRRWRGKTAGVLGGAD